LNPLRSIDRARLLPDRLIPRLRQLALGPSLPFFRTPCSSDVAPRTLKGRLIAVAWMFVSVVLVSIFTATLASIFTAERLRQNTPIRGLDDLRQIHVGTFSHSSTAQYLTANHIDYKALERMELFEALKRGKIQAVLYDEPFLRYEIRNQYEGEFTVVPLHLDTQLYAFAIREGAPLT
jgi:polar amino acid transport system substrate-binding protein